MSQSLRPLLPAPMTAFACALLRCSKKSVQTIFCFSFCIRYLLWFSLFGVTVLVVCMMSRLTFLLYTSNVNRNILKQSKGLSSHERGHVGLHGQVGGVSEGRKGKAKSHVGKINHFKIGNLMKKNALPLHIHFQEKINQKLLQKNSAIIRLSSQLLLGPNSTIHKKWYNSSDNLLRFVKNNFKNLYLPPLMHSAATHGTLQNSAMTTNRSDSKLSSSARDKNPSKEEIDEIKTQGTPLMKVVFKSVSNNPVVIKPMFRSSGIENVSFGHSVVDEFPIDPKRVKGDILPFYLQEYLNRKLQQENRDMNPNNETDKRNVTKDFDVKDEEAILELKNREKLFKTLQESKVFQEKNVNYKNLKICPEYPSTLEGPLETNLTKLEQLTVEEVLDENRMVLPGGFWTPWKNPVNPCLPRHKIVVIIPYRDRLEHLLILLSRLHRILRNQQLEYTLFVVEQLGNGTFNKGSLMNAGFLEAWTRFDATCFVFHDVDLLPQDDRNMYSCPSQPRHLSVAVDTFHYVLPYKNLVGGVLNMRGEHMFTVNGYSNLFWGWGGEDDDMSLRIKRSSLLITRPPKTLARYTMIKHTKRRSMDLNVLHVLMKTSGRRFRYEGLNTHEHKTISLRTYHLFTHLLVDIGSPPPETLDTSREDGS